MDYGCRQARRSDLAEVARIFMAAFPESIAHYFSRPPLPGVVAEPFALCLASEPAGFFVADGGSGQLAGYIFAPARTDRLPWVALTGGFALRWLWRWVTGRYGIGLAPVRLLAANKVDFLASARQPAAPAQARILSVAVHPDYRGRGIARALCRAALDRFDRIGASPVRLEVRPWNAPAVAVYAGLGFRETGTTHDSQGAWLIMLRERPLP